MASISATAAGANVGFSKNLLSIVDPPQGKIRRRPVDGQVQTVHGNRQVNPMNLS